MACGGPVAERVTQKPCKVFQPGSIQGRASSLCCFAATAQQAPCAKAIAPEPDPLRRAQRGERAKADGLFPEKS